jgi:membrane protease YdiL (CAAX protease family)
MPTTPPEAPAIAIPDVPSGLGVKGRWIPRTFTIVPWMALFLLSPTLVPQLRPLSALTWSGELLINSLCILLLAWLLPIYLKRDGLSVRDLGFEARPLKRDILQGFAAGAGIKALSFVLFSFLIRGPEVNLQMHIYSSDGIEVVSKIIFVVILAPVMEELLFRAGLIVPLGACWGRGARRDAVYVLISAVLFGCIHSLGDPIYYIGYILIGAAFACVYVKTASLRTVMIAHVLFNASGLTLGALLR